MKKLPYMPFYYNDWLSSRRIEKLSGEATKIYMFLICRQYDDQPALTLPDDDEELAALAKIPLEKWLKYKPEVMPFFESDGKGHIFNEKTMETYLAAKQKVEAGELSRLKRKEKAETAAKAKAARAAKAKAVSDR